MYTAVEIDSTERHVIIRNKQEMFTNLTKGPIIHTKLCEGAADFTSINTGVHPIGDTSLWNNPNR